MLLSVYLLCWRWPLNFWVKCPFFIIFYWIWSNIKMGKTLRPVNKPTQNWDKLQHLEHLWILTCSWQLSHCIWVIKTLPRHFKKNHHQGGSPCPAPSEWIEVKKTGMEEPVGEMEERGALKPVFREANFFGFCNSHAARCLAIWCSDEKSYTGGWQMDGMWWKSFKVKI